MNAKTPETLNTVRRALKRASGVLRGYEKVSGNTVRSYSGKVETLTDVLTDLRHYAEKHNLDFYSILDLSYRHYLAEKHGADFARREP